MNQPISLSMFLLISFTGLKRMLGSFLLPESITMSHWILPARTIIIDAAVDVSVTVYSFFLHMSRI